MSAEENKAVVRRICQEVYNEQNLALVDELYSAEYVLHPGLPTNHRGPERAKHVISQVLEVLPDVRVSIEHIVAEGDMVATSMMAEGTHRPTGKRIVAPWTDFWRLEEGKIVEEWSLTDSAQVEAQLE